MKGKTVLFCMAAAVLGSFGAGCGQNTSPSGAVSNSASVRAAHPEKVLIVFYSWGGNTRFAAEQIQKASGGTLFEIKPVKAYPADYTKCTEAAKKDIQAGVKPELAAMPQNLENYDTIFVGSPNWWGTMAPPLLSFLSAADLKGKTIIPFFTHGGGGMQNCERDVRKACPDSNLIKAAAFSGSSIKSAGEKISGWVNSVLSDKQ